MKQFKCSMSKKKESLAKKSEADYGAMTWTVTVEFDDNGKSVRKDYVVKAHNRDGAIDLAKLKPRHTNPDAKDIKVTYCKLGESLAKKSEGFMEDLPYDAPVAIDALCAEIMLHTEEFTIEDAAVAEMCGKWYIRNYAEGPTAAHNEEEWVEEVTAGLSGSPVDGSPFGAAEAEEYAHQVFKEELAEE